MKKIITSGIFVLMILSLTACNKDENKGAEENQSAIQAAEDSVSIPQQSEAEEKEGIDIIGEESKSNILVTYFTFPETDGTDADAGASRVVIGEQLMGATEFIANTIKEATGGELFSIKTIQQYPGTHKPLVDQASEEKSQNVRPELSTNIENLDAYDVIFVGYPNWWGDMPMPLYTFFEEYDFAGKTIIPFSTHGGSGFSGTINTIADLQPDATVVKDGFTVSRNSVDKAENDVIDWVKSLGY